MKPKRILLVLVSLAVIILLASAILNRSKHDIAETVVAQTLSNKPAIYCSGITKKNERCKRRVKVQGAFCWQHSKVKK